MRRWFFRVGLVLAWALPATAQPYPLRPIRMVIPQPAGGTQDTIMRALGEQLTRQMGQSFVIDNRGGANGIIAGEIVAKAAPDGYTLLYTSNSFVNNQVVHDKLPFHVMRDFTALTMVVKAQGYLVVTNAQVPAQTLSELIEFTKASRTPVHYGSGGVGNSQHLLGELINVRGGAKLVHIPYKGFAPAIAALLGNEIQVAFASPTTVVQHIRAGRLRALATSGAKRWQGLPDVPTLSEAGLPGLVYDPAWHGIFAPAALPAAIVSRMHAEVVKALTSQKMRETMDLGGHMPIGSEPAAFLRFLEAYLKDMERLSKVTGVRPT
jgi:tripartite-type tricarboxylate transporter receptor subunit TctC